VTLGENERVMGPTCPLIFFWSLKKGTRAFNFRSNEPSCDILGPHDHSWEKNNKETKQTNEHASMIFFLTKNTNVRIFVGKSLKLLQQGSMIRWI